MAVSLKKGGNVSLTKNNPGLTLLTLGLGWEPRKTDGAKFDLDASAFLLAENGKVRAGAAAATDDLSDFCFYGNKSIADGAVAHQGDNRNGEGEGDDEQIKIDLSRIPAEIKKIAVVVTIDEWAERKQNFGMVDGAYARCIDTATGEELARFDLSEDSAGETAMTFVEIYRGADAGEWKVKAIGQGYEGGLVRLANDYGIAAG